MLENGGKWSPWTRTAIEFYTRLTPWGQWGMWFVENGVATRVLPRALLFGHWVLFLEIIWATIMVGVCFWHGWVWLDDLRQIDHNNFHFPVSPLAPVGG